MIFDLLISSCEKMILCRIGKKDLRAVFYSFKFMSSGNKEVSFIIFKSIFYSDLVFLLLVTQENMLCLNQVCRSYSA